MLDEGSKDRLRTCLNRSHERIKRVTKSVSKTGYLYTTLNSLLSHEAYFEKTEEFVREKWPEISSEYVGRFCGSFEIVDPFSGDNLKLGKGAKTAIDIETIDKDVTPPFKSKDDEKLWDGDMTKFLLLATGDYNEKDIKEIERIDY